MDQTFLEIETILMQGNNAVCLFGGASSKDVFGVILFSSL